jgi:hypothetical protein
MLDRRHFLTTCSGFGLSSTLFPGTLWTLARDQGTVTKDMIEQAAIIADVPIPPEDRDAMVASLNQSVKGYDAIFALHMPNSVAPAVEFNPDAAPPHATVLGTVARRPVQSRRPRVRQRSRARRAGSHAKGLIDGAD